MSKVLKPIIADVSHARLFLMQANSENDYAFQRGNVTITMGALARGLIDYAERTIRPVSDHPPRANALLIEGAHSRTFIPLDQGNIRSAETSGRPDYNFVVTLASGATHDLWFDNLVALNNHFEQFLKTMHETGYRIVTCMADKGLPADYPREGETVYGGL